MAHSAYKKFEKGKKRVYNKAFSNLQDIIMIVGKTIDFLMLTCSGQIISRCRCKYKCCAINVNPSKMIRLHQEIERFYAYILPTPTEHAIRMEAVSRIESLVLSLWPKAQVDIYGSFRTGLYLPTSDIDLVVLGNWENLPLRTLERKLVECRIAEPMSVRVVDQAFVPIIKLTDRLSRVNVDISFNVESGVTTAELIKSYKEKYPVLSKLVLVLKQFLLQRNLNDAFIGGISSYSLVLMCISFLQLHPRQNFKNANLGALLMEFFELYGKKFNYSRTGISILGGGQYFLKKERLDLHTRRNFLYIEDPLDPKNNVGRTTFNIQHLKQAFEYGLILLQKAIYDYHRQNILGQLIKISEEVIDYRKWVKDNFETTMIQHYY